MAGLGVSYEVHFRDNFGRFRAVLDAAAMKSVEDTKDDLEELARANAPSGPGRKDYGRRPKLRTSIKGRMVSSRSAVVGASAGHARPQELGDGAHTIITTWGSHDEDTRVIHHPGVTGRHYLKRAVDAIMPKFLANMKKDYPG